MDAFVGDRVVADPLCKPFSMGRNLFCVHSRKRMDDIPELKAEKMVHSSSSCWHYCTYATKRDIFCYLLPYDGIGTSCKCKT